jgi:Asp-tRNA(Asn)/Glu-tRNA(Gln) amidotransferase A subunit family amidase
MPKLTKGRSVSSTESVDLLAEQQEFGEFDDNDTAETSGAKFTINLDQMEKVHETGKIEEQMQQAEELLDREVQEIEAINLHALKMPRHDSYEECDFEVQAAQAIQNQWHSGKKEWKKQRVGMEKYTGTKRNRQLTSNTGRRLTTRKEKTRSLGRNSPESSQKFNTSLPWSTILIF